MHASALVRIHPSASAESKPALRALVETARRIRLTAGFVHWQTFRSLDAPDCYLVLAEWETEEDLRAALAGLAFEALRARAAQSGVTLEAPEVLAGAFERRWVQQEAGAAVLRLTRAASGHAARAAEDHAFALEALAAPGSLALSGFETADGASAACCVELDSEDAIWPLLESSLRKRWATEAKRQGRSELWALNLPRLDYAAPSCPEMDLAALPVPEHGVSIRLTRSDDSGVARVQLQGRFDTEAASRCELLCRGLIAQGCRRLEMDVSGLRSVPEEAVCVLTAVARRLKEQGGQFILIDNAERVRRITRAKHLQASVR